MAIAHRHCVPGYIWHITHQTSPMAMARKVIIRLWLRLDKSDYAFGSDSTSRCHIRDFLLEFAKDRHRWRQWLYESKKRYGLVILNYTTVTSNHIHLLVHDIGGKGLISKSIQLVAGRTAQEYNIRKKRNGAFWEDRYHATINEEGEHLLHG